jgi:hypothetical protein
MCRMVLACLMFGYLAPVFWMFVEGVYFHYNKASYCAAVLPGGRNSGQKAQKGPQKKKVGRNNLWPNFG